jgi:hypothetical protein
MSSNKIYKEFLLVGLIVCLTQFNPVTAHAQTSPSPEIIINDKPFKFETKTVSEEIVINFRVGRIINKDLVVRYQNQTILLPLTEVFDLLDMSVKVDFRSKKISGYLISKDDTFEIDVSGLTAQVGKQRHPLSANDMILTASELYLKLDIFRDLFDMDMQFSFSALLVSMSLDKELPFYQKILRRQAQDKFNLKTVARKDFKYQPRQQPYLAGGVADWVIAGTPVGDGGQYYNLSLGGMLFGGDLRVSAGGNSIMGFDEQQANYRWHYYFGDGPSLTQLDVGDISTFGSLSRRLKGIRLTNRKQIPRLHFQTIDLSGQLGANWEVELYLDNKLADFVLTDAGGRYDFSVDIHYGVTDIVLKMYGPNGEMKTERRYVDVPYSLLPEGTIEYAVTTGVNDAYGRPDHVFAQTDLSYGLSDRLTTGVSTDLPLSSGSDESVLIKGDVTAKLASNMTTNLSVTPNYAAGFSFNFSQPSLLYADANFTKYFENDVLNKIGQVHRLRASLSFPLKIREQFLSMRYSVTWDKLRTFDLINMNYGSGIRLGRINFNYLGKTTIKRTSSLTSSRIISELFITPDYLRWFKPQLNLVYDHSLNELSRYGIQWSQRIFGRGQINMSLSRIPATGTNQIMVTFRLLTGFADFTSRLISTGERSSVSQVQRGSVRYDNNSHNFIFDRRNGVGAASAVVASFLDENYNGIRDEGEETVPGLKAKIEGGRSNIGGSNQQYRYSGLQAYNGYMVEIDEASLDNPWMKPVHKYYEIVCNPNVVTAIELPVVMVSEVGGQIKRQIDSLSSGIGGIKVILMNLDSETVTELTSFSNGDYFYLGFIPGSYRAYVDPNQLELLNYHSEPASIEFVIEPVQGGTTIKNIDFLLIPNN